jgi:ATP synthase protein I
MDKKKRSGTLRGLGDLASMGITMVVSTFVGLLIGIYLDKYFDTKPWLTLIFLLFGIAAGFQSLYQAVKKYGNSSGKDQDS